jgi:hypothetical protein
MRVCNHIFDDHLDDINHRASIHSDPDVHIAWVIALVNMMGFILGLCIFLGLLLVIDNYFVFATEKNSVVITIK